MGVCMSKENYKDAVNQLRAWFCPRVILTSEPPTHTMKYVQLREQNCDWGYIIMQKVSASNKKFMHKMFLYMLDYMH